MKTFGGALLEDILLREILPLFRPRNAFYWHCNHHGHPRRGTLFIRSMRGLGLSPFYDLPLKWRAIINAVHLRKKTLQHQHAWVRRRYFHRKQRAFFKGASAALRHARRPCGRQGKDVVLSLPSP